MRQFPTLHRSTRSTSFDRPAAQVWSAVAAGRAPEGRESVWYVDNPAFAFRGLLDRLLLGAGRRHPLPDRDLLAVGDRVGFWEVAEIHHGPSARRLTVTALVRAPGVVRMEVSVAESGPGSCVLTLSISFEPTGLLGTLYQLSDLPAREVVTEITHAALLADVDRVIDG